MQWKGRELEWILDHGFRIDAEGMILIPQSKLEHLALTNVFEGQNVNTVMIPSGIGLYVLSEGTHFRIMED